MPAVLCPVGQVWDQLPGSNCVSCTTCTDYAESPWCPNCFLGTDTPTTLEADLSWVWAVAVLIVAVLLIIVITIYWWKKIGRKYGGQHPVTVKTSTVKETAMAARLVPTGAAYV
ncbi:uncharacterized protein LOC144919697 [Branchiostoma floridae x Branchiostoma belcheri]